MLESLEGKAQLSVLLRLVLNIIVLALVVLSSLLIHSLLAVSVETRTFELGVMRMLGKLVWPSQAHDTRPCKHSHHMIRTFRTVALTKRLPMRT